MLCIFAFCWISCLISIASAQEVLSPEIFFAGIQNGDFDAVIDVRSESEWVSVGHIDNATLVANLAISGTTPDSIMGCKDCTIAVYCQSGNRAGQAIVRLQTEFGFMGTLYNALGVSQWKEAGYPLVYTDSVTPPCEASECVSCSADCSTTDPPMTEEDSSEAYFGRVNISCFIVLFASIAGLWIV